MSNYHERGLSMDDSEWSEDKADALLESYCALQSEWNAIAEQQQTGLTETSAYDVRALYQRHQRLLAIVDEMWRIQLKINELSRRRRSSST